MKLSGGCHCRTVRFEVEVPDPPIPALDCNCSVCRMTGYLHINVPHERFELVTGRDSLARSRSYPHGWRVTGNCPAAPVQLIAETFGTRARSAAKGSRSGHETRG